MKKLAIRTVDGLYEGLLNKKVINFVIQMKEENR